MISVRTVLVALLVAAPLGAVPLGAQPLRVFTLRAESLERAKQRVRAGDPTLTPAYEALVGDAKDAMMVGPYSVMDKHRVPPSGDKHDYVSFAPYFWPDSTKPNGLPYVRRDGERNPETRVDADHERLAETIDAVTTLALAFHFARDERYARRAIRLLRVWFLDPSTRMNPNLRYGQAVPGVSDGRSFGIIETHDLTRIVDAAGVLARSRSWTPADQRGMVDWCQAYMGWLRNSPLGVEERAAANNHGSWYDAQTVALALFVGDTVYARSVLTESVPRRLATQVKDDGSQPEELARTRSFSYSLFNLEALTRLAELGRHAGVDLWRTTTPAGAALRRALAYVAPYADSTRAWPGPQITPASPADLLAVLRRAAQATGDTTFHSAIRKISPRVAATDRSRLLYPDTP